MFDLNALPAWYVGKYGVAKIAEVLGQKTGILGMWMKSGKFPLDSVQTLLEFDPAPLSTITPLYTNPEPGTKLVILVPLAGPPAPKMMDSLVRLIDKKDMDYRRFGFNCLSIVRNVLAAQFLRGPWTYAWWQDGDSVVPSGDADWYREAVELPQMPDAFAGLHSIHRALWHRKTIVSCSYIARRKGGPPQFGGGETTEMRNLIKRGPQDRLIEVPWSGMGGMLTHRSVFESIIATQGEEIKMKPDGIGKRFGFTYGFFNPINGEIPSDDVPFCIRAAKAGHRTHVDLAIQAAHVGDRATRSRLWTSSTGGFGQT